MYEPVPLHIKSPEVANVPGYTVLLEHGCMNKFKIPPALMETLLYHLEIGRQSRRHDDRRCDGME